MRRSAPKCQARLLGCTISAAIYYGARGTKSTASATTSTSMYVATDWDHHFPVASAPWRMASTPPSDAQRHEPAKCWELINLSEKTRKHCMILENCCYDWFELDSLNMAQKVSSVKCSMPKGAYIHNLDPVLGRLLE